MNWDEILQWSQKGFIACCALVLQLTLMLAVGQEARGLKLKPVHPPCSAGAKSASGQPAGTRGPNCPK